MSRQGETTHAPGRAEPVLVGVDVGGTKILAGRVCASSGEVTGLVRRATPAIAQGHLALEDAVAAAIAETCSGAPLRAVGVGAAGFVDESGDRVRFAPHLAWRDRALRVVLEERWGVHVALENDASCAALAEQRYGAALGARSMLMVTVGTGIGGAIVIGGELFRGANGMAGEFGHARVVPDGLACECGLAGCWEQYCSGRALVRRAAEELAQRPQSHLHQLADGDPAKLTGPMVTAAADAGDPAALAALAAVGDWLGVGLANLVAALDPEVVVVGGGVAEAGDRLLASARRALGRSLVGAGHRSVPDVVGAALGSAACVVGAASLAAGLA